MHTHTDNVANKGDGDRRSSRYRRQTVAGFPTINLDLDCQPMNPTRAERPRRSVKGRSKTSPPKGDTPKLAHSCHSVHQNTPAPAPSLKKEHHSSTPTENQILLSDAQSAKRRLFKPENSDFGAILGEEENEKMATFQSQHPIATIATNLGLQPWLLDQRIILRPNNTAAISMGPSPLCSWQQQQQQQQQHGLWHDQGRLSTPPSPKVAGACNPPAHSPASTSYSTPHATLVHGPPHPGTGWGSCGPFA